MRSKEGQGFRKLCESFVKGSERLVKILFQRFLRSFKLFQGPCGLERFGVGSMQKLKGVDRFGYAHCRFAEGFEQRVPIGSKGSNSSNKSSKLQQALERFEHLKQSHDLHLFGAR